MAVPIAGILDDFDWTGTLGPAHGWEGFAYSDVSSILLTANGSQCSGPSSSAAGKLSAVRGSYTQTEAFFKIVSSAGNGTSFYLLARIQDAGTSSARAYGLRLTAGIGSWGSAALGIFDHALAPTTSLSAGAAPSVFVPVRMLLRVYERVDTPVAPYVEVWTDNNTATWTQLFRGFDTSAGAITATGAVGLAVDCGISGNQAHVDDFGGGEITVPTATINSDTVPGLTGMVVIEDDVENGDADVGTFRSNGANGTLPVPSQPELADYPSRPPTATGGSLAGEGGGVSVFT